MKNLKELRFFDRVTLSFAQMPLIWGQNSNFIGQNADNHCSVKIVKYTADETAQKNYRV